VWQEKGEWGEATGRPHVWSIRATTATDTTIAATTTTSTGLTSMGSCEACEACEGGEGDRALRGNAARTARIGGGERCDVFYTVPGPLHYNHSSLAFRKDRTRRTYLHLTRRGETWKGQDVRLTKSIHGQSSAYAVHVAHPISRESCAAHCTENARTSLTSGAE
jgi:hypothetical protein